MALSKEEILDAISEMSVNDIVDLTPRGIRDHLELHKPIYKSSASYGHFGREAGKDGSFPWEKTNLVDQLKNI